MRRKSLVLQHMRSAFIRRTFVVNTSQYALGVPKSVAQWAARLQELDRSQWPEFLDANSGLPGPRANTSLAIALAAVADSHLIDELLRSDDEYRMMCGAVCLGALVTSPGVAARLRPFATNERWRVREGVVLGMQEAGDHDLGAVQSVVRDWADDTDPLIARAAAATVCEPRLLRTHQAAAIAIDRLRAS